MASIKEQATVQGGEAAAAAAVPSAQGLRQQDASGQKRKQDDLAVAEKPAGGDQPPLKRKAVADAAPAHANPAPQEAENGGGTGNNNNGAAANDLMASTLALASSCAEPKNLRILVCDSDNDSSNATCNILQDCSYTVTSVKTSKQALEQLDKNGGKFDMILKEHNPPKSDACRMLKKIWRHKTYRNIPVVITSHRYDSAIVQKCLQHGAADYMLKPLRHNEARTLWIRVWTRLVALQCSGKDSPLSAQQQANNNVLAAAAEVHANGAAAAHHHHHHDHDAGAPPPLLTLNNMQKHNLKEAQQQQQRDHAGGRKKGPNGAAGNGGVNGPTGGDQDTGSGMSTQSDADVDGDSQEGSNPNDQNEKGLITPDDCDPRGMNVDQDRDLQPRTHDHIHGGTNDRAGPSTLHLLQQKLKREGSPDDNKDGTNTTSNGLGTKTQMTNSAFQAFNSPWTWKREKEGNGDSNGKNAASNIVGPQHGNGSNGNGSNGNGSNGNGSNGNGHESNGASSRRIMPKLQQPQGVDAKLDQPQQMRVGSATGLPVHPAAAPHQSVFQQDSNMTLTPFGPMPSHLAQSVFWGMAAQQEMNYLTAMQYHVPNAGMAANAAMVAAAQQQAGMAAANQLQQQHGANPSALAAAAAAAAAAADPNQLAEKMQQQHGKGKQAGVGKKGANAAGESAMAMYDDPTTGSGKTTSTQTGALAHSGKMAVNGKGSHAGGSGSAGGVSQAEQTSAERRAAALDKYRQKRKTLCFSKKIRYASRKQLAEARPRNKGQFVRCNEKQNTESGSGSGSASNEASAGNSREGNTAEAKDAAATATATANTTLAAAEAKE